MTITVGKVLTQLQCQVDETITNPDNEGKESLIDAGIAVEKAIARASAAYVGILHHTQSGLNTIAQKDQAMLRAQKVFDALAELAEAVINQNTKLLPSVVQAAELIDNRLPFKYLTPQLLSVTPLLSASVDDRVCLICLGYFPHIERAANEPRLEFDNQKVRPVSKKEDRLEFDVPRSVLSAGLNSKGRLLVPYSFVGPLRDAILPVFIKRPKATCYEGRRCCPQESLHQLPAQSL